MQSAKKNSSPLKKSGKSEIVVPSRYKQAALRKATSKGSTPSHLNPKQNNVSDSSLEFSVTPLKWSQLEDSTKRMEVTSTPAADITTVPICDASAISANQSVMPTLKDPLVSKGRKNKLAVKSNFRCRNENVTLPVIVLPEAQKKKDLKSSDQLTDAELDLLYAQYTQTVFLKSRAKKSLLVKAEAALEDLHKLCSVNQINMEKEKFYVQELNTLNFVNQQWEYCKKQKDVYGTALNTISTIIPLYEEISKSLESVRNKLHAPDVFFSSDASFHDELVHAVQEYDMVLHSFLSTFKPEQTDLSEATAVLHKVSRLINELDMEIERCSRLLSAANHMIANESSLKIAELHLKEQQ